MNTSCCTGLQAVPCTPSVTNTPFSYLDAQGCLVGGIERVTITCAPDTRTVECLDAFGVTLPACPPKLPVSYVIPQKCPDVPVTVPALDSTMCDGSTVDVQTAQLANQVVNAPGTALLVKMICDEKFDREFVILCAPDGTKVITQNVTPEDAPLGTAPVIEAWTLAGTAYTGDISLLTDCGAEKIDLTAAEWFCASGVPISRSDAWDVSVSPRALIGSIWQDVSGAVVPAPAAGSYVVGDCSCVSVPQGILVSWG